jgi:predicted MPP superfamily phosphohydrolase
MNPTRKNGSPAAASTNNSDADGDAPANSDTVPGNGDVANEASTKTSPRRISRRSAITLGVLGTATALAGYAYGVEPRWVSVVHHDMAIPKLPPHLVGKTAVQLSDTHIGNRVDKEYLLRQFKYVQSLQPDFVFFTGDFVDKATLWHVDQAKKLLDHFPRGSSGTAFVLGNHDFDTHTPSSRSNNSSTAQLIDHFHEAEGIELLDDDVVDFDGLKVAGLPDLWYGGFNRMVSKRTIEKVSGAPSIVLSHNPDSADLPIWGDFDSWLLCGHTHGGQCNFPLIGAPILPVNNKAYVSGEFQFDQWKMYINRGLGHSTRVRFMARPEITIFTLQKAQLR